ncbi:hypothetical protein J4558_14980 [Leptolyngbya sp. 15MV]|nr:hypothetical protein J4558_14980 [Leptolyngbya sp. 15MV]
MVSTTIHTIAPHVLMADLAEPFAYSQAWYRRRGAMLVEITTRDGITGWGEAFGPPELTAPIVAWLSPLVIGQDAMAREAIWQSRRIGSRSSTTARGGRRPAPRRAPAAPPARCGGPARPWWAG